MFRGVFGGRKRTDEPESYRPTAPSDALNGPVYDWTPELVAEHLVSKLPGLGNLYASRIIREGIDGAYLITATSEEVDHIVSIMLDARGARDQFQLRDYIQGLKISAGAVGGMSEKNIMSKKVGNRGRAPPPRKPQNTVTTTMVEKALAEQNLEFMWDLLQLLVSRTDYNNALEVGKVNMNSNE